MYITTTISFVIGGGAEKGIAKSDQNGMLSRYLESRVANKTSVFLENAYGNSSRRTVYYERTNKTQTPNDDDHYQTIHHLLFFLRGNNTPNDSRTHHRWRDPEPQS
jgi:hypothetical protein